MPPVRTFGQGDIFKTSAECWDSDVRQEALKPSQQHPLGRGQALGGQVMLRVWGHLPVQGAS